MIESFEIERLKYRIAKRLSKKEIEVFLLSLISFEEEINYLNYCEKYKKYIPTYLSKFKFQV